MADLIELYEKARLLNLQNLAHGKIDLNRETVSNLDYLDYVFSAELELRRQAAIQRNKNASRLPQRVFEPSRLKPGIAYEPIEIEQAIMEKGINTMRIAVTYENGEVFQHFGHSEQFKLYDVEDGKIVNEQIVDTNGTGHGALAGSLKAAKADALICGGIGMGAQTALADEGISFYAGVQGSADAAAKALAEGKLDYDPDAKCDHSGHHEDGHDCGHHEDGHGSGHHGEGPDCGHHHGE